LYNTTQIIEIEGLKDLPDGIYTKSKEFELGHYLTIIIDKKKISFDINIETDNSTVPDFITFLLIIDTQFPSSPPRILAKTNVYIGLNIFSFVFRA